MSGQFGVSFLRRREVRGDLVIGECDKYTKVYNSAYNRGLVMGLPSCAHTLLWYIVFKCEPKSYEIDLNRGKYMRESGVSLNTFKRAVRCLEMSDILKLKGGSVYYFDYTLIFQGSKVGTGIPEVYPYE